MRMLTIVAILVIPGLSADAVREAGQRAADWQLTHSMEMVGGDHRAPAAETDWTTATFYIGLSKWVLSSGQVKYLDAVKNLGERTNWQIGHLNWGPPIYYADDHAIGQVYVAAFDHFGDRRMIEPLVQRLEYILAHPPQVSLVYDESERRCMARWCWSDALFMGPATWFGVARVQNDRRFRDYADKEFWLAKDFLFDKEDHLFYRDSRFFNRRGDHGEKLFWSRGNGWVIAGLVNILRELSPDDPSRERYEKLLIEMADRLAPLQRSDGFWPTSLLALPPHGIAESSGTAFIAYGLAAGVNMGILDAQRFAPVVERAWRALQSVTIEGKLGRVQQIGDKPDVVRDTDSQLYGTGGLLLFASELTR